MYICVRFAGLSQVQAGALFGRDRTTVAHAVECIASRIAADPAFAKEIDALVAACRRSSTRHPIPAHERSP
jgi:chromosomal replication initiation ATPase DnaA